MRLVNIRNPRNKSNPNSGLWQYNSPLVHWNTYLTESGLCELEFASSCRLVPSSNCFLLQFNSSEADERGNNKRMQKRLKENLRADLKQICSWDEDMWSFALIGLGGMKPGPRSVTRTIERHPQRNGLEPDSIPRNHWEREIELEESLKRLRDGISWALIYVRMGRKCSTFWWVTKF